MTSMWSSPERRTEHCAGCDSEQMFEQPRAMAGHGVRPEPVLTVGGRAPLVAMVTA